MRAAGSGTWAGLFNTHFWVDPATGVTGSIFSQTLPFFDPRTLEETARLSTLRFGAPEVFYESLTHVVWL